jgi:hypothetical protein
LKTIKIAADKGLSANIIRGHLTGMIWLKKVKRFEDFSLV